MSIYKIIIETLLKLKEIKEKETNVKIAGGRGYSAGKIYPDKTVGVTKSLGKEENLEQESYTLKPVKISKAFKRRKNK